MCELRSEACPSRCEEGLSTHPRIIVGTCCSTVPSYCSWAPSRPHVILPLASCVPEPLRFAAPDAEQMEEGVGGVVKCTLSRAMYAGEAMRRPDHGLPPYLTITFSISSPTPIPTRVGLNDSGHWPLATQAIQLIFTVFRVAYARHYCYRHRQDLLSKLTYSSNTQ